MADDNLTRDDLILLMESYQNMIIMHQTILDQTTHTVEKLDNIITKQDVISTKQGKLCVTLDNVAGKLDECASALKDSNTSIQTHALKSVEDHAKITNKVHLGWVGMGSIIVSLIGIILMLMHYGSDILAAIAKI